jgi:hypothetical protein
MAKRIDTRKYSDRAEYLKEAVVLRRRALKKRAIELMGGACLLCGYDKHPGVLEFHHLDATTKSFSISGGGFSRSWESLTIELRKCILVCANCHREVELGLHDLAHINALAKSVPVQIDPDAA